MPQGIVYAGLLALVAAGVNPNPAPLLFGLAVLVLGAKLGGLLAKRATGGGAHKLERIVTDQSDIVDNPSGPLESSVVDERCRERDTFVLAIENPDVYEGYSERYDRSFVTRVLSESILFSSENFIGLTM